MKHAIDLEVTGRIVATDFTPPEFTPGLAYATRDAVMFGNELYMRPDGTEMVLNDTQAMRRPKDDHPQWYCTHERIIGGAAINPFDTGIKYWGGVHPSTFGYTCSLAMWDPNGILLPYGDVWTLSQPTTNSYWDIFWDLDKRPRADAQGSTLSIVTSGNYNYS